MEYNEAKDKFLESWGMMAGHWGISRSMALVHAYLLMSPKALCADVLMAELQLSRGSVNTQLRALMDWGLVHKKYLPGERKDHYYAEKDMWVVFRQILIHRKQKELEPLKAALDALGQVKEEDENSRELSSIVHQLKDATEKTDAALSNIAKSKESIFENPLLNVLK